MIYQKKKSEKSYIKWFTAVCRRRGIGSGNGFWVNCCNKGRSVRVVMVRIGGEYMFCPSCGTEGKEGGRYCAKCGRQLPEVFFMEETEKKEDGKMRDAFLTEAKNIFPEMKDTKPKNVFQEMKDIEPMNVLSEIKSTEPEDKLQGTETAEAKNIFLGMKTTDSQNELQEMENTEAQNIFPETESTDPKMKFQEMETKEPKNIFPETESADTQTKFQKMETTEPQNIFQKIKTTNPKNDFLPHENEECPASSPQEENEPAQGGTFVIRKSTVKKALLGVAGFILLIILMVHYFSNRRIHQVKEGVLSDYNYGICIGDALHQWFDGTEEWMRFQGVAGWMWRWSAPRVNTCILYRGDTNLRGHLRQVKARCPASTKDFPKTPLTHPPFPVIMSS